MKENNPRVDSVWNKLGYIFLWAINRHLETVIEIIAVQTKIVIHLYFKPLFETKET